MGQKIGEGSFAVVKLGFDMKCEKVAIKLFNREGLQSEDEAALTEEISILKSLKHSGIVSVRDFFEDPKYFYMVMEHINGGELFDYLVTKSTYNEAEARRIALEIIKIIEYCHSRNIVHR
jgi:serine/threonine protein kinase